ncbi:MAG: aminotransferase class V-fold PLP-dependent enzyme [Dehalococcoidales bacterium]|nr:aminotransferase class V-fold PLP-dependent enzyme [Dehalococcoidales bacterium]
MIGEEELQSIRQDFPALSNRHNNKFPVYFDNACTTLVPRTVIESMNEYYTHFPACGGGRSRYWFAEEVTSRIEGSEERSIRGSRPAVRDFIHARSEKEIIFCANTSQAINMVALGFKFRRGDNVLLTDKEHNSNLIPWLRLQKSGLVNVNHVSPAPDGTFDLDAFQKIIEIRPVRLVSMAYTSNLTGYTIPSEEIVRIAHAHGARVLLDAAQTVPHQAIDVQALDVDFMAFSIHKMCGPRGVGVLYAKKELLGNKLHEEEGDTDAIEPAILGGGTVADSTYNSYGLLDPPERFETGLQNYSGQIGAAAAVEYLTRVGFERIKAHETGLNSFLTRELLERYGDTGWFKILGPQDPALRGGLLTFEVRRPNAVSISEELSDKGNIMIRDGVYCVHSYFNHIYGEGWSRPKHPSEHHMTYRVSLYFYNTLEECRLFLDTLNRIFEERCYI